MKRVYFDAESALAHAVFRGGAVWRVPEPDYDPGESWDEFETRVPKRTISVALCRFLFGVDFFLFLEKLVPGEIFGPFEEGCVPHSQLDRVVEWLNEVGNRDLGSRDDDVDFLVGTSIELQTEYRVKASCRELRTELFEVIGFVGEAARNGAAIQLWM